jgi:hypothetical protein
MDCSVCLATVAMTSTDLYGNLPYADSPDSMTASVPSRTAIAMSLTCRDVGRKTSGLTATLRAGEET